MQKNRSTEGAAVSGVSVGQEVQPEFEVTDGETKTVRRPNWDREVRPETDPAGKNRKTRLTQANTARRKVGPRMAKKPITFPGRYRGGSLARVLGGT